MPNVNFNDENITNIILNEHKYGVSALSNLVLESASDALRKDATNMLQTTFTHQKQLFDLMVRKGWYQVQAASQQDITGAQQSMSGYQLTT